MRTAATAVLRLYTALRLQLDGVWEQAPTWQISVHPRCARRTLRAWDAQP
ncbi:hypothetical protein SAMN05216213_107103 [Ectopseudomonas guguanensis]|uniref:Uncharacterized protein n=1 Tax=Ectopseudomonas guguanensis TaxID=1198456 RepID=A0A1H0WIL6_9GAMM|nr:hypothetical protein SAMN05216213_107103 [Pseudomonas guguanensis]